MASGEREPGEATGGQENWTAWPAGVRVAVEHDRKDRQIVGLIGLVAVIGRAMAVLPRDDRPGF
jgi:hypothetical protein